MSCGMQRFRSLGKQMVPLGEFEIALSIEEVGFTCKRGKPSFPLQLGSRLLPAKGSFSVSGLARAS